MERGNETARVSVLVSSDGPFLLAETIPTTARIDNGEWRLRCDGQQVLVSSDQEICSARDCRCKHPLVILITNGKQGWRSGLGDDRRIAQLRLDGGRQFRRCVEPIPQHSTKLNQIHLTGE